MPKGGINTMTERTDEQNRRLIQQCLQIAALHDELIPTKFGNAEGYRIGGANPYHHQTASGLYLEFYYGYPSKLWTPWGEWSFGGSHSTPAGVIAEQVCAAFMERLTLDLYKAGHQSEWGYFGPYYAVQRIEGEQIEVPGAVLANGPSDGGMSYERAKAEWARHGGPHTVYSDAGGSTA